MMENLTSNEENAIEKLRTLMENELPAETLKDTHFIYKFLKARNFNVAQAEAMLRKKMIPSNFGECHLKQYQFDLMKTNFRWRKEMQVDLITTDFKPSKVLTEYVSQNFLGFDKEGCPVKYNAVGNIDSIGLYKSSNILNILRYVIQGIEKDVQMLKQQSIKLGRPVTQIISIYDMKNLTLAKATHSKSIQSFRDGMAVFQDNYPELLKQFYVINASMYFTIAFPVIKVILANAVLSKIQVFGKDGWKEELLKVIDCDVLPAFLGGNRTDPDGNPDCITIFNHGGPIPESYYLKKNIEKMAQKEGVKFVRIERRADIRVPVSIQVPRSVLHWEFETKNYDIGFGLTFESSSDESTIELIPVHKIETDIEPECGLYRCEATGVYNIVFDNTFSWFHCKELYYRTWVTNTEDD